MTTHLSPIPENGLRPAGLRLARSAVALAALVAVAFWAGGSSAFAATGTVGLATAAPYSVLGGQAVTNTGPTTLSGDLGVSPGTAITGFPPGIIGGAPHAADAVAAQAQSDLTVAYDDAAGRASTQGVAGDLVGRTLIDGVYTSSGPLALSGTLTFDGQGNPDAVFIVQVASTLTTATASQVNTINGAQACHIFWQVGSSATLGTASTFQGTILALTSISVTTGAVVKGRALARNGSVTLDNDQFTSPACDTVVTPTSTPTSTSPSQPPTTSAAATSVAASAASTRPNATPSTGGGPGGGPGGGAGGGANVGGPNVAGPNSGGPGRLAATGVSGNAGGIGLAFLLGGGGLIYLARIRPARASARRASGTGRSAPRRARRH